MKKTLAAALAAAVVVGTGATTFAAANPFSDVPRGHWSYKAVKSLAEEGIIEGYGDGTYRGDRLITRYEMAQMIAKALAKTDARFAQKSGLTGKINESMAKLSDEADPPVIRPHGNGSDAHVGQGGDVNKLKEETLKELKSLIVEYRPELESLGAKDAIRAYLGEIDEMSQKVDEMWKFHDKVQWHGKIEYTYKSARSERAVRNADGTFTKVDGKDKINMDDWIFRFEPIMEVNKHWTLRSRIDAHVDLSRDTGSKFSIERGWAQGDYDKFQVIVGRAPLYTNEDGIVWDTQYTGAQVSVGSKWKLTAYGGRLEAGDVKGSIRNAGYWDGRQDDGKGSKSFHNGSYNGGGNDPSSFWAVNVQYDQGGTGLFGGGAYYNLRDDDFKTKAYSESGEDNKAKIWSANLGYRFTDKARVWGAYAKNTEADNENYSWQALFQYGNLYGGGGAAPVSKGRWSVWAGYKRLGSNSSLCAINWDDCYAGTKGVVAGASWAPMDNVVFLAKYFKGKYITGPGDAERLFGRVEFFY